MKRLRVVKEFDVTGKAESEIERTDCQRINTAFRKLRKAGYIALANHLCCQNCAWSSIGVRVKDSGGDPETVKAVFWHAQGHDFAFNPFPLPKSFKPGMLQDDLHLYWSGNGHEIARALEAEGLTVRWNGTEHDAIAVVALKTDD